MKTPIATIRIKCGRMGTLPVRPFFLTLVAAMLLLCGCQMGVEQEKEPPKKIAEVVPSRQAVELTLKGIAAKDGDRGFSIQPSVNRTGSDLRELDGGAVEAVLPPRAWLAYQAGSKRPIDVSNFTHLAFEMEFSEDMGVCQVVISSDSGLWKSKPLAVTRGVNQILLSVHQLWRSVDFDLRAVRAVSVGFPDAEVKREFVLRNMRFLRDLREISPVPAGLGFTQIGWDYILKFAGSGENMELVRGDDGLWRFGLAQPVMRLARFGGKFSESGGEDLDAMGKDCFGEAELLEHNIVRVRLVDTWYFAGFEGGIHAFTNRYIRWAYTIYGDGRCVVLAELDNSGGPELGKVEISLRSQRGAWYGVGVGGSMLENSFIGPVGKWAFMMVQGGKNRVDFFRNYLKPAELKPILARNDVFAPGDADRDGFDESQGCYYLAARPGGCKFEVICDGNPLFRPIFRISGPWKKLPVVAVEGRRIGKVVLLGDGSALFELPGEYAKNFIVEVMGSTGR